MKEIYKEVIRNSIQVAIDNGAGYEEIKRLYDGGFDFKEVYGDDNYLLFMAAYEGDLNFVKLMLSVGMDINRGGEEGLTPLYGAVIGRHPALVYDCVKFLVESGAKVDDECDGMTIINHAESMGDKRVERFLKKHSTAK